MRPPSEFEFAFASGRSGSGPATWGQHAVWDVVRTLGTDAARYNVCGGGAVEPGLPVARVAGALGELFLVHDSLRTTLHQYEDSGETRLRQQVHSSGRSALTVWECAPEEVGARAGELLRRLAADPFDVEHGWPARFGVVESGGLVRYMVLVLSHTAVDAWGLRHLVDDLSGLALGGEHARRVRERADRMQPLEEAEYQASERGRRQDAASRRHWRTKLGLGPHRLFGAQAPAEAALPFPNAALDSPALALGLSKVAARHAVSSSAVLLAAASAMTARLSGSGDAVFQVVVNNRFQPGLERAVSTAAQEGVFHLPAADAPFRDLVRRSVGASLSAYRNAYYHKAALERDIAALREENEVLSDLTCFFNDTRGVMPGQGVAEGDEGRDTSPDALEQARGRTTLSWPVEFPPRSNVTFALDVVDSPGSVGLSMTADSSLIPRPHMERFLYGIEDLVVSEAIALS